MRLATKSCSSLWEQTVLRKEKKLHQKKAVMCEYAWVYVGGVRVYGCVFRVWMGARVRAPVRVYVIVRGCKRAPCACACACTLCVRTCMPNCQ